MWQERDGSVVAHVDNARAQWLSCSSHVDPALPYKLPQWLKTVGAGRRAVAIAQLYGEDHVEHFLSDLQVRRISVNCRSSFSFILQTLFVLSLTGAAEHFELYTHTVASLLNAGERTIENFPKLFTALPTVLVPQLLTRNLGDGLIEHVRYLAEDLQDVGREEDNEEMVAAGRLMERLLEDRDE